MRRQELHPRTAVLNKSQKNKSKMARMKALTWLSTTFPQAFDNSVRIRPLKIGILEDIFKYADKAAELGISRSKIREALVVFTRRVDYLACLKARELRIDLEGNPMDAVTDEEAEMASQKIKKRIEKSIRNNKLTKSVYTHEFTSSPITAAKTVIIKHKNTRQYDPGAVARLKEKLGLSRASEMAD